jgi:membrane-bound acyltransferase YfiQ involved in biofilm formation
MVLTFILFFGAKIKAKKGTWHEDFLSLETTKAIQGFCAITIVVHHLSQRLNEQEILYPFSQIGVLLVGIFFFSASLYTLFRYSYWAELRGGSGIPERWICLAFQVPAIVFFVFSIFTMALKIKCLGPIVKFLGTITLEFYLIHNLFIDLFKSPFVYVKSDTLYLYLVILSSVAFAFPLKKLDDYLIKLINGKIGGAKDEKMSLN